MELWHNPRCSKSRAAKALLDERGVAYDVRFYVDAPPSAGELDRVLTALAREPWEITRMGDPLAREIGLRDGSPLADLAKPRASSTVFACSIVKR